MQCYDEITKEDRHFLATKVMGWELVGSCYYGKDGLFGMYVSMWKPDKSNRNAAMLRRAWCANGRSLRLFITAKGVVACATWPGAARSEALAGTEALASTLAIMRAARTMESSNG